jgi:expansin
MRFFLIRSVTPILLAASLSARAGCPPPYTAASHATFYDAGTGSACGIANVDGMTTALTSRRWLNSAHCGECLRVTGPLGATIVKITDECPDCNASDLDMTRGAFAKIGNTNDGIIPISWERVDCPVTGNIALQIQNGVNQYYMSFLADLARQGITAISIREFGGAVWEPLARQSYGYFIIQSQSGNGFGFPLSVQLTSQSGEVLQLSNAIPNATQSVTYATSAQFGACADRVFANDFGSES